LPSTHPVLCGSIAGRPGRFGVAMHTAAFEAAGLVYAYVAFGTDDTAGAMAAMRTLGIRGLGVTTPHKVRIMEHLDDVDAVARTIGAVNTVVNDDGRLTGYNVDWIGANRAFGERLQVAGREVAVVGAGGGARAIVYGLVREGAAVSLFNRTPAAGETLARALGATFAGSPEALALANGDGRFDLLVHVTPVGFHDPDGMLVPAAALHPRTVVFDAVAQPPETRLLREAKALGCPTLGGVRMQLHQAARQFELYTGRSPSLSVMEDALARALVSTG
jgi:shikimate dehydrogenase